MSRDLRAAFGLDLADAIRSRWLFASLAVYAVIGGVFVFVGLGESTLLGFTGMGRVLLSSSHAILLVLPLLALTATSQVVSRARENGSLELLFSLPIRRSAYFIGVSLARVAALGLPLLALMLVLGLLARFVFGQPVPWGILLRTSLVSFALLVSFAGIGLAISISVKSASRAVTLSLIAWLLGAALLDFALLALLLKWRLPAQLVFGLALANPVEAARLGLLSAIAPDLGVLGAAGFYLSTHLGAPLLFAIGVAWPIALGLIAWALALLKFLRGDVV
jgi:ABC-2 type transport system permease protein